MKEGAEYPARGVTDFQADDSSSRPHHAQHLAESLSNIAQVAHCESGTAAVDAVVGQIDVLGIPGAQFDPVLQAQALDLSASNLQHLRRDVHTDHTRSRSSLANNRDGEVRRTGAKVKPHFTASQGQVTRGNSTPALVQPKTHQAIHRIVYAGNTPEEPLHVGSLAPRLAKFFFQVDAH